MTKPAAPDPAIGIWELNIERSSFALAPAPKSNVMTINTWHDGLKVSADITDCDGKRHHWQTGYKFDGKDYPVGGSSVADTISATRVSARKTESVWKRDGHLVFTAKTIISSDGKTLTVMRIGRDPEGRIAGEVLVYDRQ
jgi:hypothetical protein